MMIASLPNKTFIKSSETPNSIRVDFIIALLPVIIWSIIRFGFRAFVILVVSAISTFVAYYVIQFILNKKACSLTLYPLYCGIFLALTLYPSTSVLLAGIAGVLCSFFIVVFNSESDGIVFAPIVARLITFELIPNRINKPDFMPYESYLNGNLPVESSFDFLLGTVDGAIGTVSVIAITIGVIYLLFRKAADFKVSVAYLVTLAALYFAFHGVADSGGEAIIYGVLSGDAIFVSVFAMTDFSVTPITTAGKYIKGLVCAVITFVLRLSGFTCEAVFLAVMISDILFKIVSKLIMNRMIEKEVNDE